MKRQGRLVAVSLLLVSALMGVEGAQATTFSKPGLTATAKVTVKPKRLPMKGTVPVTMDFTVRTTRTTPGTPNNLTLRTVAVQTDKQITVDTEGLPSCPFEKVQGTNSLGEARKACRSALIGTGKATSVLQFPDRPANTLHTSLLLFNTTEKGTPKLLLYAITHGGIEEIGLPGEIGDIRSFKIGFPYETDWTMSDTLLLKIGARWKYKGKWHSYLNGTCAKGAIRNKVTMTMSNGTVNGATTQRCGKRG